MEATGSDEYQRDTNKEKNWLQKSDSGNPGIIKGRKKGRECVGMESMDMMEAARAQSHICNQVPKLQLPHL